MGRKIIKKAKLQQTALLILLSFIINIFLNNLNTSFAEDKTALTQSASETKKISEQTDLIEKTLELEAKEAADISAYLNEIKKKKTEFDSEINVYKIEITTFGNQLHLPDVDSKVIEKAYMSCQAELNKVTQELLKLKEKTEQLKQSHQVYYKQKSDNDKFLMELQINNEQNIKRLDNIAQKNNIERENILENQENSKSSSEQNKDIKKNNDKNNNSEKLSFEQQLDLGKNGDPKQIISLEDKLLEEQRAAKEQDILIKQQELEKQKAEEDQHNAIRKLVVKLKYLQTSLTKKMLIIQSSYEIINEQIPILEDIEAKYKTLANELETRIKDTKKAELLTRKSNPLTQNTWKSLGEDAAELSSIILSLTEKESWINSFSFLWLSGIHKIAAFIVVLFILIMVSLRCKILLKKISESSHFEKHYWSKIVIDIFRSNLFLSAATAFFYLCIKFKIFFNYSIIANLIVEILMFLVFILWMIRFLEHIQKKYPSKTLKELIFFHKALNLAAVIYILLGNALKSDSSIIIAYRLLCELIFYGWLIYFFKKLLPEINTYFVKKSKISQVLPPLLKHGGITIAVTGIILELLGYGTLAFYWYTSWGKTIVVLMWSGLIISASGEWMPAGVHSSSQTGESYAHAHLHSKNSFSILWLVKQVTFIALFFLVTITLMLSWASSDLVLPKIYTILAYKFVIGSMSFSILTFVQAVTLLIVTHFIAKSWRHFFQKNFLGNSGLDQGLQESMTTISIYSIWIFGIFISLIVFGLNTTTLTVAFGALSIGLGFGLQNIFSNFISGIILLFERPIQVGDDIEVNGLWATVKKTNVRSTVVQTYDNATIIIPNSELISNRVTNWSFKDKRLRRKITIGVEYGSDIELVRSTLLEIAGRTAKVLKYPEPDVLFEDFGASALIFTLRFWTFTDYFLSIETEMRFKIDKLFKERNIVIAFPQQDINIKSLPADFLKSLESNSNNK